MDKNKLIGMFIFLFIYSCGSNKEHTVDKRIYNQIELIQVKLDSAVVIYDSAIADIKSGNSRQNVHAKYNHKILNLHKRVAYLVDVITFDYENKKINPKEYDKFIKGINTGEVQKKSKELESLGVKFDTK